MGIFRGLYQSYDILTPTEDVINLDDFVYESLMYINSSYMDLCISHSQSSYLYETIGLPEIVEEGFQEFGIKAREFIKKMITFIKKIYRKCTEFLYKKIRGSNAFFKKYKLTPEKLNEAGVTYIHIDNDIGYACANLSAASKIPNESVLTDTLSDCTDIISALDKKDSISKEKLDNLVNSPKTLETKYGNMINSSAITKEELVTNVKKILNGESSEYKTDIDYIFKILQTIESYIEVIKQNEADVMVKFKTFEKAANDKLEAKIKDEGSSWNNSTESKLRTVIGFLNKVVNAYMHIYSIKIQWLSKTYKGITTAIVDAYTHREMGGDD